MGGRTERPEFTDRVRVELAGGGREVGHRRPKSDLQMSAPPLEKGQCCR